MNGLPSIPSTKDLGRAYDSLALGQPVSERDFTLWTQWCRFDPRLAEILMNHLANRWKQMDWSALRDQLLKHPWPQAFGVLTEAILASDLLARAERKIFRGWSATVLTGVARAPHEQFFFGLRKVAGSEMLKDVVDSSRIYSKWGYFGRDLLVNKTSRFDHRTVVPPEIRRRLLCELMEKQSRITVSDYRTVLDQRVSRRQAELDLAREKRLMPVGNTRGRFYRVRSGR